MAERSGYWTVVDGQPVSKQDAETAWAEAARVRLGEVAASYHATIEYGALADEIQVSSGIRSRVPMRHWIGGVLGDVARGNRDHAAPPLTALVVQAGTGMVGDGYDEVLRLAGMVPIHDPVEREDHAATARLECYRWAGAELPPGGGRPALAPRLRAARERAARLRRPSSPPNLCPTCSIAMPVTGVCDSCS